jgi:hypothetical protein
MVEGFKAPLSIDLKINMIDDLEVINSSSFSFSIAPWLWRQKTT